MMQVLMNEEADKSVNQGALRHHGNKRKALVRRWGPSIRAKTLRLEQIEGLGVSGSIRWFLAPECALPGWREASGFECYRYVPPGLGHARQRRSGCLFGLSSTMERQSSRGIIYLWANLCLVPRARGNSVVDVGQVVAIDSAIVSSQSCLSQVTRRQQPSCFYWRRWRRL
ncbi:hypothetical protein IF1G_11427 [Cordyceps javanica]|uniref:Uncharacterized protein n=1 Tax=Cordyceps javanica TaxID=43265 RepID=A0A545UKC2_9HYPO|nr:hypothetical protein IF1G_11427 [Cordyceps javanica]